jgi:hypothetical protein
LLNKSKWLLLLRELLEYFEPICDVKSAFLFTSLEFIRLGVAGVPIPIIRFLELRVDVRENSQLSRIEK